MSTATQKLVLTTHVQGWLAHTHAAEDRATDVVQQITARRLRKMLTATLVWIEELPEDGSVSTIWQTPTGVAFLEALGFEEV